MKAARADGKPMLSQAVGPGQTFKPYRIDDSELFDPFDLAIFECRSDVMR